MGYRNACLHNTIMVRYWHIPSLWFTPLHLDFNEMYLSCHHQMTVLTRHIFRHEIYVNNIITLSYHFFKKVSHHNYVTNLVCELSIAIGLHQPTFNLCTCIKKYATYPSLAGGAITTNTSPASIFSNIKKILNIYMHVYKIRGLNIQSNIMYLA